HESSTEGPANQGNGIRGDIEDPQAHLCISLTSVTEAIKAAREAWDEYDVSGQDPHLSDCIEKHREALALCPIGDPDRSCLLERIRYALTKRFEHNSDVNDLDKAIDYLLESLSLRSPGHPLRYDTLCGLGGALITRYHQTGNSADLEKSIEYQQENLSICPIGHSGRSSALNNLGVALMTRYKQTGERADLEESIQRRLENLAICPIGHSDRCFALNNLGIALLTLYEKTGNKADLDKSIQYQQENLSICPIGHSGRELAVNNLGIALLTRYEKTGKRADLDESICHQQENLSNSPIGNIGRPFALNNLGMALMTRYQQTGNRADLDESIRHQEEKLSLCPIGHSGRSMALNNLAIALMTRYKQTGNKDDLDESIRHRQENLSTCPLGHFNRFFALHSLSVGLLMRYKDTDNWADLDESIHCEQESLSICPIGHSGRESTLNNLSMALLTRYGKAGNKTDLDESIRHQRDKLSICPIGHLGRWWALNNLGIALHKRYEQGGSESDVKDSISYFKDAAAYAVSPLPSRLDSATNWILMARRYDTTTLAEAYSTYLYLLNRSILLASNIHDRHSRLTSAPWSGRHNTVDAVSFAIEKHQPRLAVELLEQGRGLMFTQLGNYRTSLDHLDAVNKELADRFRILSATMEQNALSSRGGTGIDVNGEDMIARYQKQADDWDKTVEEIRQLKDFESFLQATPFVILQKAAVSGPVIMVNISQYGSAAIIVQETGEPHCVPLPKATPSVIETLSKKVKETTTDPPEPEVSDRIFTGILRDIWSSIVGPIVYHLERVLKLPRGSRIWWIPTSAVWLLPLHASGLFTPGKRNMPDRYVSSYTPTLSSLLRARTGYQPISSPSGPRLLLVAQRAVEGEKEQLVTVQEESALIRRLPVRITVVEGEDCKREKVLAGLQNTSWIHFACHGKQHPTEPFKSQFSLRGGDAPLTLIDIIQNGLPQADLAVLSACHSAEGDRGAPDETIHLAAGVLFSGFRSVVGTMWAMTDVDGPVIAEAFYNYMLRNGPEGIDCRDAAKALYMGVKELRRRKVPMERWVTLVHYGI
ncbi:hypothetical protein FRB97_008245, partial [Tulasnella sp. 331]